MDKDFTLCRTAALMMDRVATRTTLTSRPISGYLPNYPRISRIKSIMEVVVCRGRIILNYQWVKFLKWKNPSMMNTVDGLRCLQEQQIKVGIRHQVETIKASRICMQTWVATSTIQIQLQTKGISRVVAAHPKTIISQRKRRRTCFYTHRGRVEQRSIAQRTNLPSWLAKEISSIKG